MTRRLMTVGECAEYIGRTPRAVESLVYRREIPFVKHGRSLRFDVYKIENWINEHSEDVAS